MFARVCVCLCVRISTEENNRHEWGIVTRNRPWQMNYFGACNMKKYATWQSGYLSLPHQRQVGKTEEKRYNEFHLLMWCVIFRKTKIDVNYSYVNKQKWNLTWGLSYLNSGFQTLPIITHVPFEHYLFLLWNRLSCIKPLSSQCLIMDKIFYGMLYKHYKSHRKAKPWP